MQAGRFQMQNTTVSFNQRALIYALADAIGYIGIDDLYHGKRVGYMAYLVAQKIGDADLPPDFMFDLGVLHDIGVSTTKAFKHLVAEFEWENRDQHCEVGYKRLLKSSSLRGFAEPVRYHHTKWSVLSADDMTPVKRQANLIYLLDRVDAMAVPYYQDQTLLSATASIKSRVIERSGEHFCPQFVEAFLEVANNVSFWLGLEDRSIRFFEEERLAEDARCELPIAEVKAIAEIFAEVVDAKSVFTYEHSQGVARIASLLAKELGFSSDDRTAIEISGLLHDLGKLRIPDEILDKPGPLNPVERSIMNTHSYESFQILRRIKGLEEITRWAVAHHEEPGATGYPFGLDGETLPIQSRILRVADIIQAVVQDRPYRRGMSEEQTRDVLQDLIQKGKIDPEVGQLAIRNLKSIMAIASTDDRIEA